MKQKQAKIHKARQEEEQVRTESARKQERNSKDKEKLQADECSGDRNDTHIVSSGKKLQVRQLWLRDKALLKVLNIKTYVYTQSQDNSDASTHHSPDASLHHNTTYHKNI